MSLEQMNESHLELVKKEMAEYQIDLENEVENVREWINNQPHLPTHDNKDNRIKNQIYGKKFSVERAKQNMDNYYSLRNELPEFLQDRDPLHPGLQAVLQESYFTFFPTLTKEGYRVVFLGFLESKDEKPVIEDYFKVLLMFLEILQVEDFHTGIVVVCDMSESTLNRMMRTTLPILKRFMFYAHSCIPNRVKKVILVNSPNYFEFLGNLVKSVLNPKIKERFFIHSKDDGYEPMWEVLGKENCPLETGGSWIPLQTFIDQWNNKLISYRDWFLKEDQKRSIESKRTTKQTNFEKELGGTTGTFRKLVLD